MEDIVAVVHLCLLPTRVDLRIPALPKAHQVAIHVRERAPRAHVWIEVGSSHDGICIALEIVSGTFQQTEIAASPVRLQHLLGAQPPLV